MSSTTPDFRRTRTDRLDLRAVTPDDADTLHPLLSDPLLWGHDPAGRHTDISQSRRWTALAAERWCDGLSYWTVAKLGTDEVIGHGGAQLHCGDHWNLSYRIRVDAQGNGYAVELAAAARNAAALVEPHLPVIAWIDPPNTASQRVAVRIGLICRGLRRARPNRPLQLAFSDRELNHPD